MTDERTYSAFFDELGRIERQRMLTKVAINPLSLGNVARTGLGMLKTPAQSAKMVGKIYAGGAAKAGKGADTLTRVGKGVGALWGTPGGRAAVLGGGATLAAGGLGASYLGGRQAGRSSAAPGF